MNVEDLVRNPEILNKKIYRIFSFERFCQLLVNEELTFVSPNLWDDPFEDYFLNRTYLTESGERISFKTFSKNTYGQCWTLTEESDALWRIYSRDNLGIRVSTTVRKVLDCIFSNLDHTERHLAKHNQILFADSVEYKSLSMMKNEIDSFDYNPLNGDLRIKCLFTKRDEFIHESEFRFVFNNYANPIGEPVISFKCNIMNFIDEICLDPRLDDAIFSFLKVSISNRLKNIPVNKSKMYDFNI
ncbi:TPA: hypothetical protein ACMDN1_003408 [Vibrio cholerae]